MIRTIIFFFLFFPATVFFAQEIKFSVQSTPEICQKGSAQFQVTGAYDSLYYVWSTGQINLPTINGLDAGNYSVKSHVMRRHDTIRYSKDTTLFFTVEKELCPLLIPKYFSPNSDGYNDFFIIGNIESFPNFELSIFNKWGQRVHYQKEKFVPWDGKWMGAYLADGAYYFILLYDKNKSSEYIKNDVTILR